MVRSFAAFSFGASDQREIIVSVARIFVTPQCLREMIGCLPVFTAAIVRDTQRDVRRRKTGISFQRFVKGRAGVALLALLIKGQALDVSLLGARWYSGVRKGPRRRLEVRITIPRREVVIADQLAPVLALKANRKRRWKHILNGQRDGGGEGLGRVEVNTLTSSAIF